MKSILAAVSVASLIALGAAPASAAMIQSVNPANTNWVATGPTTLTRGSTTLNCTATFEGTVDNSTGIALVNKAKFTGGFLNSCALVTLNNTPWTMTASSTTGGTIFNVSATLPLGIGTCGSNDIVGTWDDPNHKLSYTNALLTGNPAPDCYTSSSGLIAPNLKIIP